MSSVSTQPAQRRSSAAAEIAAGASGDVEVDAAAHGCVVRDAMDVDEAAARHDVLDVGAAEARGQIARQRDLALGPRREVGVPAFGRPTARTGRRRCAAAPRRGRCRPRSAPMLPPRSASPSCSTCSLRFAQHRHRVRHRLEIVQQRDARECRAPPRRGARRRTTARWSASTVSPTTGPATPKQAASIAPCARALGRVVSFRNSRDHRRQIGDSRACRTSGRRPAAAAPARRRTARAASWCRRCRRRESLRECVRVLDFASILHHLGAVSSPQPISRRGRLPSPSPESSRVTARGTARRLHRKAQLARPQGRARARHAPRRRDRRRRQREDDDAGHRRRRIRSDARCRRRIGRRRIEPRRRDKSNKLKRAEELNAQPGASADSDSDRGGVLPARRRADARHAEAAVSRDARPARALPRRCARITCAIW